MSSKFTILMTLIFLACISFAAGLFAQRFFVAPPGVGRPTLEPFGESKKVEPKVESEVDLVEDKKADIKPLYLHWFTPSYALREGPQPPSRLMSIRVHPGQEISVVQETSYPWLKGKIDFREGKYHAKLVGDYGSSRGFYTGEVELEKAFEPTEYFLSNAVYATKFVLSYKPECDEFLKQAAQTNRKN
jgi:hypothetical protein